MAINLEPEESVDEQVDTTRELHVDEALKRFQTALKLHAQGPRARAAAGEAYRELFRSEIFTYREAKTDYERADRHAHAQPAESPSEPFAAGLDIDAVGGDGVADSLSQALYLSYKNLGQFYLDKLKDQVSSDPQWKKTNVRYREDEGKLIIDAWVAALDQDPSDPELWRRMARFAGSMNSGRVKRFCLEAAIELDDDPTAMDVEPPSLAEGFAGEQLKDYLRVLDDEMALSHPIMKPWLHKQMPNFIRRHLDPFPFLPDPSADLTFVVPPKSAEALSDAESLTVDSENYHETLTKHVSSWPELGLRLLKCLQDTGGALKACQLVRRAARDTESCSQQSGEQKDTEGQDLTVGLSEGSLEDKLKTETPASNGPSLQSSEAAVKAAEQNQKERDTSASTRKRSQSLAGLADGADEDNAIEKRSKRVRRRTDIKEVEESTDPTVLIATQLQPFQDADLDLFRLTKNILETLGVEDHDTLDCIQELLDSCAVEDRPSKITGVCTNDLRSVMCAFDEDTAMALLNKKEQATLGLSSFLEHAKTGPLEKPKLPAFDEKDGLVAFSEKISQHASWMTSDDVVFEWVRSVSQSYAISTWSDTMKVTVVQMLNRVDAVLFERIARCLASAASQEELASLDTMVPMLFELHVDIYERITNPSSAVDYATRMETKYRLGRWMAVASTYIRFIDRPDSDSTCVRYLWASIMTSSLANNPVREHILLLWTSIRDFLTAKDIEPINLPNNVVMPSISAAAAEREISKLTTMDFFLGLFQGEMEDPVQVIETLEPVLNPSSVITSADGADGLEDVEASAQPTAKHVPVSECAGQGLRDLWKFLSSSSTELRLFLWARLGDAYAAIHYHTKRLSCTLKGIEMIIKDLAGEAYITTPDDSRRTLFMRTLKSLDELLIQALSMGLNEGGVFEIIDQAHIKSSVSALARLSGILHVASLCEDEIRLGIASAPSNNSTFTSLVNKLREMQVRTWCLQYTLFKAGLPQQDGVLSVANDLADFLATIHRALGLRKFCAASNKIFLKMMRMELLRWSDVENWEDHLGQVLYDLHGLKLGVGVWEVQDHGCVYDKLERRQAMTLVEKVMVLAHRMPMKDLLKSDLKTTIEHLQQAIGQTKSTPQMIHNLRSFTEILKRPIHPLRLYQALSGGVSADAVGVNIPEAALAKHGWFFLLGMIALTKFKGVDLNRRQTPGATDDLRIGATFLRLQLQFTADNWQAWFRLAECFDYELDESVLWTADKMNKDRTELVKFQRNAIHCYTVALSNSRHADVGVSDEDALHDLYHKFAMRLYSSSREPFAMEPFEHSDQERFFIEATGAGTFRRILHDQMSEYKVWKLAAKLFRMAMSRKPGYWMNSYMLAKCYWKMYQTPAERLDKKDETNRISIEQLLDTLKVSIEVATGARKSRNSDPILEPHHKIVSITHKLVMRGDLPAAEAASILSEQPLGIPVSPEDHYASFSEPEDWEEYVIRSLTRLRDKDKSNWHHRIVMRHAKILAEGSGTPDNPGLIEARAAFALLKENMFTKTMVMNVWKCDAERPGRHHVFTEQYVRFMTGLLCTLSDRVNLELLLRRLRKKGADFYHFSDLWQLCCLAYLNLLRTTHNVGTASEDAFKSLPGEEFEIISERITQWAAGEGPHIAELSCMKEAVELKKLNANLMKAAPIDDLINDCYTRIYLDVAGKLPGMEPSKVIAERNHAREVAAELEAVALAELKAPSSLSNILNPSNGRDGLAGTLTPNDVEKSEAAPRGRRGVRRPDILRKAEQAVIRSLEAPAKSVASKSRVGSVSSKRDSHTPVVAMSEAGSSDADDEGADARVGRELAEDGDEEMKDAEATEEVGDDEEHDHHRAEGKYDTEVGSIHDSADESDLSDVPDGYDEEVPPGLLFPNLIRPEHSAEASGMETDEGDRHDADETEDEVEDDENGFDLSQEHGRQADEGTEVEDDEDDERDMDEGDETEEEAEEAEEAEETEESEGAEEAEEAEEEEAEEGEAEVVVQVQAQHDHVDGGGVEADRNDEDTEMGEGDTTAPVDAQSTTGLDD